MYAIVKHHLTYCCSGYVVVRNWMTPAETALLQQDAIAVDGHVGKDCTIGKGLIRTRDDGVRRSRQSPFYPPPPNTAGSTATRAMMIEAADELRRQLQASEALALPQLQPFDTELNYLCYPVGGHYKRHLDQPYGDSGWVQQGRRASNGGSLCGSRTRRVVSFILYLNSGWDAADGGALRVFPAHPRITCDGQRRRGTRNI